MARKPKSAVAQNPTRRILNLIPSHGTERDWSVAVGLAAGALKARPLPAEVDLRESWWRIGDQGGTGSCVGWATADGVMRYLLVKAGRLGREEELSVRFVWMGSKETDEFTSRPQTFIEEAGTSLKAAADICRKYGVPTANDLPFEIRTTMYLGKEQDLYARASLRKAASYYNARRDTVDWKRALAAGTPIVAGLSVDAGFNDAPASGLLDRYTASHANGGHAVAIVGYRADGRFIVRNSWGEAWGDRGFAYVTPDYVSAAFFGESYVLTL